MKRFLLLLIGVAAVVAFVTAPASAADLKFGGMFWTKYYSTDNIRDGYDDLDDNGNGFYTRMRLYFTAQASENLMAVFKAELDDIWGDGRIGSVSTDGGSDGRADAGDTGGSANSGMEIKNAYIQFNMPNTPLSFMVGELPIKLGSGLAFNDDTNGIVAMAKFDPVKVALAYSRLNDNASSISGVTPATFTNSSDDWNLWAAHVGFSPMKELGLGLAFTYVETSANDADFEHYNAVLDVDFKTDVFSAYFTGGMNFGGIDEGFNAAVDEDADFKGWMVSAGGAFNVGPVTIGVDGYYSPGQEIDDVTVAADGTITRSYKGDDIDFYVTPGVDGRNTYYMDEVVFPGMFDDESATISTFPGGGSFINNVSSTGLTRTNAGYTLTNIWAIGAHVDFKPLEQTLLQAGAAYMQFVEDVASEINDDGSIEKDNALGTSVYLRLTQGIVDGLQLKVAAGYLFVDDGYSLADDDEDAYKVAAGLFWSW